MLTDTPEQNIDMQPVTDVPQQTVVEGINIT